MDKQGQRRPRIRTIITWLVRLLYVSAVLFVLTYLYFVSPLSRRPVALKDKPKYGDFYPFYKMGAPFSCIYVGLNSNEVSAFQSTFIHIAESNSIHPVVKHYMQYSGPGCANYMSDHGAFFVRTIPTSDIIARQRGLGSEIMTQLKNQTMETGEFDFAFHDFIFWPTNACRLEDNGTLTLAPFTVYIHTVAFDGQISLDDFKKLIDSLESALHNNWQAGMSRHSLTSTRSEGALLC